MESSPAGRIYYNSVGLETDLLFQCLHHTDKRARTQSGQTIL